MGKKPILILILLIVCSSLGIEILRASKFGILIPATASAAPVNGRLLRGPDSPLACPAAPAGLPDLVEGTHSCIFYDANDTTLAQAQDVAAYVDAYWARYVDDFGFLAPSYPDKVQAYLLDSPDCNGFTAYSLSYFTIYDGCFTFGDEMVQLVTGHELFHRVQYTYNLDTRWFREGTARAMEDNVFDNIDNWAGALAALSSFNKEVNNYLVSTNNDITSDPMRYKSALWWKYMSEQYGSDPDEPELGVDAWLALWQAAVVADDIAAVNNALSALGSSDNFDDAFRQFIVANWTKDLTGVPNGSYNYADEDQVGNPAPYGPLVPTDLGTIDSVTSATSGAQVIKRYGAHYYSITPNAADCPVITVNFSRSAGSAEFYHIITQNGAAFNTHVEGSGASWTQSFLNDGITKVVAILGGQSSSPTVNITFSCTDPVIAIELPNTGAPTYVGPFNGPDDIVVQVSVTNGSPTGPVVGGLINSDFQVEVGGSLAAVLNGGFVQEEYFLLVDTPTQAANGPYDLEVFLEEPGTSTVIASDTEIDAVVYDATNTDYVIITDVSGSMGWDGKMAAAVDSTNLFIDATNSTDGLGLASFSTDVVDTLGIEFATLPHRTDAHTQVNNYVPTFATSIGDGLDEAVAQRAASPTGNARCQFALLSDGMENQPLHWADVQADVVATGCPVMTIAFGEDSNELLMEDIATATGGVFYYNDVYVSALAGGGGSSDDTELDLGDTYMYALCEGQRCKRLLSVRGSLGYAETMTHTLMVDSSVSELDVVLDWWPYYGGPGEWRAGSSFSLRLLSPSGTLYDPSQYAFADDRSGYAAYHVEDPEDGEWQVAVTSFFDDNDKPYQVSAFGQTSVEVKLLPVAGDDATGDYVTLYAFWRPGGSVVATVTALDGTQTTLLMHDDGQHGDGAAGDGFFAALYTVVNQAQEVQPVDEEGSPNPPLAADEGAYRVHLLATDGDLRRETQGAFAVVEGEDTNGDTVPDDFIDTHCPGAPNSDLDLDKVSCADEYYTGTDPNNSDTDGSGESDESEALRHGLDPFNPDDDVIDAPEFVHVTAGNGEALLTYDVKDSYETIMAYRATSPNGPWSLINTELPLVGNYVDTTVTNGITYYYCIQAIDAADHWSAVVCGTAVEPRLDPVNPEASVVINAGAASTDIPTVSLTFFPLEEEHELGTFGDGDPFSDITEVLLSNSPDMSGATWQPFLQGIEWDLLPGQGFRTVYVRFRDVNGNESVGTETATIYLEGSTQLYLPVVRSQP